MRNCRVLLALALASVPLLAGCSAPPAGLVPQPCPAPQIDTSGWQEIDASWYTFRLPPEFKPKDVQGIDSDLRAFESPSAEVTGALGSFTSSLSGFGRQEGYTECEESIGGKKAKIVAFRTDGDPGPEGWLFAGAYWADVGTDPNRVFLGLTITGVNSNPQAHEQILAALRTVRFKP